MNGDMLLGLFMGLVLALLGLWLVGFLSMVLGRVSVLRGKRQVFYLVWRKGSDFEIIPLRTGQLVELETELFAEALTDGFVEVTRADGNSMIVREGYAHTPRADGCSFRLYVGTKSRDRAQAYVDRRKVINELRNRFGYDPK